MMLVIFVQVLQFVLVGCYVVMGVVILGWEDMCVFVVVVEVEGDFIILQVGLFCCVYMFLLILGMMFCILVEVVSVLVVVYFDYGYIVEECCIVIDSGFFLVMFDGLCKLLV